MLSDQDSDRAGEGDGAGHYVYLYRDYAGKPKYVGYGEYPDRAESHAVETHNSDLRDFLEDEEYRLEIAGPYGSEETARLVEASLISALGSKLFNIDPGDPGGRFRPYGVPPKFVQRLEQEHLTREQFLDSNSGPAMCPILFDHISNEELNNRKGYNPADPPSDREIRERIEKWWQVDTFLEAGRENGWGAPGLLVGVHGRPGGQFIVGALHIDVAKCDAAESKDFIPTSGPDDLDAFHLRGRRISRGANIKFGPWNQQCFLILWCNGRICGGAPLLYKKKP